jgi:2-polyprenyl-3-methyl-5-hydroxy-6-metoxy-1,4-benzoquinol methylase
MPLRFLHNAEEAGVIVARFADSTQQPRGTSYATVRDYCESMDQLPQITGIDGDLKNVQRPWAVKAILSQVPPPARVLEFGGGEPIVSGLLAELGYETTLVDPYDGFGKGPTAYESFLQQFPHVRIVREYFRPSLPGLVPQFFDAILSVSVLEHLEGDSLTRCFDAIAEFLRPGGASIHCFDIIVQGPGDAHDFIQAQKILAEQNRVTSDPDEKPFIELLERLRGDVETFFLAPQGHHQWRGGRPYTDFPFRKVVSIQTVGRR